jgi:hypothetical protein
VYYNIRDRLVEGLVLMDAVTEGVQEGFSLMDELATERNPVCIV